MIQYLNIKNFSKVAVLYPQKQKPSRLTSLVFSEMPKYGIEIVQNVNYAPGDYTSMETAARQLFKIDQFEHTLENAIRKAVRTGEISETVEPTLTAAALNFYLQGMMKLSLLSYSAAKLHQQTEYLLHSLGL